MKYIEVVILVMLLLTYPDAASGGPISYAACMAIVVSASFFGSAAILPALGFTSSGIAAGSWAATWMASFGGAVPAGSLFATLQAAGASGASWNSIAAVAGGVSNLCAALCAPFP